MNVINLVTNNLNEEIFYKISEIEQLSGKATDYDFVCYVSNGDHVTVKFNGIEIWNTQTVEVYENLSPEKQIELFTVENLTKLFKQLIQDQINMWQTLNMIK